MQKEGDASDDESEGGRREGRGRRGSSVGGRRVDGGRLRVVWNDQIETDDIVGLWKTEISLS